MAKSHRICSVQDCDKKHFGNGFCGTHNYRFKKYGNPLFLMHQTTSGECSKRGCKEPVKYRRLCQTHYSETRPACPVDGCAKPIHAHGYCARHAYHFKAHGDPLGGRRGASPGAPLQWIKDHAEYSGDDCIKWPFEVTYHGYGSVKHKGKKRVASRVMCEEAHGLAPAKNMDAAHSCGNGHEACMNPNHLSWKTRAENIEDSKAHGTWQRGNLRKASILDPDKVRKIRAMAKTMMQKEVAEVMGISAGLVQKVVARTTWAWVE